MLMLRERRLLLCGGVKIEYPFCRGSAPHQILTAFISVRDESLCCFSAPWVIAAHRGSVPKWSRLRSSLRSELRTGRQTGRLPKVLSEANG